MFSHHYNPNSPRFFLTLKCADFDSGLLLVQTEALPSLYLLLPLRLSPSVMHSPRSLSLPLSIYYHNSGISLSFPSNNVCDIRMHACELCDGDGVLADGGLLEMQKPSGSRQHERRTIATPRLQFPDCVTCVISMVPCHRRCICMPTPSVNANILKQIGGP